MVIGETKELLNINRGHHDKRSHHDNDWEHRYPTWTLGTLTKDEYKTMKIMSYEPRFWATLRNAFRQL